MTDTVGFPIRLRIRFCDRTDFQDSGKDKTPYSKLNMMMIVGGRGGQRVGGGLSVVARTINPLNKNANRFSPDFTAIREPPVISTNVGIYLVHVIRP